MDSTGMERDWIELVFVIQVKEIKMTTNSKMNRNFLSGKAYHVLGVWS